MSTRIFVGVLVAGVLFGGISAPAISQALTGEEVQAQIAELLQRIRSLNEQITQLQGGSTILDAFGNGREISPKAAEKRVTKLEKKICKIVARNLVRGNAGEDVSALQEFLQSEGFFNGDITGFFGPITEEALKRWQAHTGIISFGDAFTTGWGRFGPLSKKTIKEWCLKTFPGGGDSDEGNDGNDGNGQEFFSATPVTGSAPLTVTFSTRLSGFRPNTVYYTIDFGDNTSERAANCPAPADACTGPGTNIHTYAHNGTYTATLNRITDPCVGQQACAAAIHMEEVARLQVWVGTTPVCTKEYKPVCGAKPIVCITTPCNPIPTTYGNRCEMNADGASFIHEGQCGGTAGRNLPPTISSFGGPTTLNIGEIGTWNVSAFDPENDSLTYRVDWGQGGSGFSDFRDAAAAFFSEMFTQNTSFTHSYERAGTYTVTVFVKDNKGASAKTTTTVRVGSEPVACTLEYNPVCGRPPGCANTCPSGQFCTAVCQLHTPQTYGNRCAMNAANATFLHQGECNASSGNIQTL